MPKIPNETNGEVKPLRPYWQTSDRERCRLYQGDCQEVLKQLPDGSVQCCVTSPPYFGLRDYGTATWEGGDEGCDHVGTVMRTAPPGTEKQASNRGASAVTSGDCRKCGARRIDAQLGLEKTPQEYVARMVAVFREVRRVLRDDGTLWLNLGDSYAATTKGSSGKGEKQITNAGTLLPDRRWRIPDGLKPKDLIGIPWRVAFALQDDGWYLRQDIIWAKPSPMPESVTDRCTKAHEYVFLLSKSPRYYYDAEAIAEPMSSKPHAPGNRPRRTGGGQDFGDGRELAIWGKDGTRNRRSVWTVATQPYPGAHFATFPPALIRPMILAGTSERGACGSCGAPWRRVVEKTKLTRERPNQYVKRTGEDGTGNSCPNGVAGVDVRTVGWEAGCSCGEGAGVRPCVVLDPFFGSGTTAVVALEEGRSVVGVELSDGYLTENAIPRIKGVLRSRPALRGLVG